MKKEPQHFLQPVAFHGDTLFVIEHNKEPYTPMRTMVENMGLDWDGQRKRINRNKERWGAVMMTAPSDGGAQKYLCLPVRKLPGFLSTIDVNRVRNSLRTKIIEYQNECDNALWDYWNHGQAVNHRKEETKKYKSLSNLARQFRAAISLAKAAGLKGSQAVRQANKMVRDVTGEDCLEILDITGLEADGHDSRLPIANNSCPKLTDSLLADFVEACCVLDPDAVTHSTELYNRLTEWYRQNYGLLVPTQRRFGDLMTIHFAKLKNTGIIRYQGLKLRFDLEVNHG